MELSAEENNSDDEDGNFVAAVLGPCARSAVLGDGSFSEGEAEWSD
jgi:hypothetical protein